MELKLSENFTLNELIYSETAERLNIDNRPSVQVIENLRQLAINVLQPVRTHFGVPIHITSGFRSSTLNKAIGGVAQSQHQMGQAADFIIKKDAKEVFDFIKNHLIFDQLLFEYDSKDNRWFHVSYKHDLKNRNQAIYNYFHKK